MQALEQRAPPSALDGLYLCSKLILANNLSVSKNYASRCSSCFSVSAAPTELNGDIGCATELSESSFHNVSPCCDRLLIRCDRPPALAPRTLQLAYGDGGAFQPRLELHTPEKGEAGNVSYHTDIEPSSPLTQPSICYNSTGFDCTDGIRPLELANNGTEPPLALDVLGWGENVSAAFTEHHSKQRHEAEPSRVLQQPLRRPTPGARARISHLRAGHDAQDRPGRPSSTRTPP